MLVGGIIIISQTDISIVISHVSLAFNFYFFVENYCRNVDRPELCQISLYDFQKFLQMDQKVLLSAQYRTVKQKQKLLCAHLCLRVMSGVLGH